MGRARVLVMSPWLRRDRGDTGRSLSKKPLRYTPRICIFSIIVLNVINGFHLGKKKSPYTQKSGALSGT